MSKDAIKFENCTKLKKTQQFILAAGGIPVPIRENFSVSLQIGGLRTNCDVKVIDTLPAPMIIGAKFLSRYHAVLNFHTNVLTLESRVLRTAIKISNDLSNLKVETTSVQNHVMERVSQRAKFDVSTFYTDNYRKSEIDEIARCLKNIGEKSIVSSSHNDPSQSTINCCMSAQSTELHAYANFIKKPPDPNNEIVRCLIEESESRQNERKYDCIISWELNASLQNKAEETIEGTRIRIQLMPKTLEKFDIWSTLALLRDTITKRKAKCVLLKKPAFTQNKEICEKDFQNMLTNVFAHTEVDITVSPAQPSTPRISTTCVSDNSAYTTAIIHSWDDKSPVQEKQKNACNSYVNHKGVTAHKARLCGDHNIKPFQKIKVPLYLDIEGEISKSELVFYAKDSFLTRNKLLISIEDIHETPITAVIESLNNQEVVLFRGTTVGYASPKPIQNLMAGLLAANEKFQIPQPMLHEKRQFEINSNLSPSEHFRLKTLLKEFDDCFADSLAEIGCTPLMEHRIELTDETPFKSKPYRVSPQEREFINDQVEEMLKYGIISHSQSSYSSPIVLVKKKGEKGKTRFCVDFRKLNSITKKSSYPLPNIDEMLTYLQNAKYYTHLDLFSGYWNVPIEENSRKYTAFVTPGLGLFQFNRLAFGLCCAPNTFQELTDRVFWGLKWSTLLLYLDDVILFSETFDEHLERLRVVFSRIREARLTLKTTKCRFAMEEIKVLGHIVTNNNIQPDPEKLAAVSNFPPLTTKKQVQRFLGLCSYYRKFIENFAQIAKPLYTLTSEKVRFRWGPNEEKAFKELKRKMTEPPVLAHFNPHIGCELRTDASHDGIGVIVLQQQQGEKHPIAYASRNLTKAEKNYPISELEALAVIYGLTHFRHFIYGKPVTIVSDHHALCHLKIRDNATGRLARWLIKLQEFDHKIVFKSGQAHRDADCLSRSPVFPPPTDSENDPFDTPLLTMLDQNMAREQRKDKSIVDLIQALEGNADDLSMGLRKRAKNFRLIDNLLYKRNPTPHGKNNLLVIPGHLKYEILFSNHCEPLAGHLGMNKTYSKLKHRFYWSGMEKDIEKFVRGCPDCQHRKGATNKKPAGLLQPIEVGLPFERVSIDILGPFKRTKAGNTVIAVAADYATKWVEAMALPDSKSETVAQFILGHIITRHGCCKYLHSDRGKNWRSQLVTDLLKLMGIKPSYTTAYHPQCDGLVEKQNLTICNSLAIYTDTNQDYWDIALKHIVFAYNTAEQASTKFSPFFLVYGREAILPTESSLTFRSEIRTVQEIREQVLAARALAITNNALRQGYDKARYDKKHQHVEYCPGESIKIFTPLRIKGKSPKLMCRWHGPYTVVERKGDVNYKIRKGDSSSAPTEVVHVSRMQPYYAEFAKDDEPRMNEYSDEKN